MTPPLRANPPRSLLGIGSPRRNPAGPPEGTVITTETIEAITGGGQYVVRGVVTPTAGPARLVVGQRVQVAWKNGRPVAILAGQAQRAQFGDVPIESELLVAGVVEELFVADNDVWFRNAQQVTKLNIRALLPGDPEYVKWGARGEAFLVRTPTHRYSIFTLNRLATRPIGAAPLVATFVRTDVPLTSEIPLFTLDLAYQHTTRNRYLHLRYVNVLVESASVLFESTVLAATDMKGGTTRVKLRNLGSGAGATLTFCEVRVKATATDAPSYVDNFTFVGLAAGVTLEVILPVPVPWIEIVASAIDTTNLLLVVPAVKATPFTLPGLANAAATRQITLRNIFGDDLFNDFMEVTDAVLDDRLHLILSFTLSVGNAYRISGPVPGTTIPSQRSRVTGVAEGAPLNLAFTLPCPVVTDPMEGSPSVVTEPMTSTIASAISSTLNMGNHTFLVDITSREVLWKSCRDEVALRSLRTDDTLWSAITSETQIRDGVVTEKTCQGKPLRSGALLLGVGGLDLTYPDTDRYKIVGSTSIPLLLSIPEIGTADVAETNETVTIVDVARCPFLTEQTAPGTDDTEIVERVWIARITNSAGSPVDFVTVKYRYRLRRVIPAQTFREKTPNFIGGGIFSMAAQYARRPLTLGEDGLLSGSPRGVLYVQVARVHGLNPDTMDFGLFAIDLALSGPAGLAAFQALTMSTTSDNFSFGHPALIVLSAIPDRVLWRFRSSEVPLAATEIDAVRLGRRTPLVSQLALRVVSPSYDEVTPDPAPPGKQPMLNWLALRLTLLAPDFLYWVSGEAFAKGWDGAGVPILSGDNPPVLDTNLQGFGILRPLPEGVTPREAQNQVDPAIPPDHQFSFVPHKTPGPSFQVVVST